MRHHIVENFYGRSHETMCVGVPYCIGGSETAHKCTLPLVQQGQGLVTMGGDVVFCLYHNSLYWDHLLGDFPVLGTDNCFVTCMYVHCWRLSTGTQIVGSSHKGLLVVNLLVRADPSVYELLWIETGQGGVDMHFLHKILFHFLCSSNWGQAWFLHSAGSPIVDGVSGPWSFCDFPNHCTRDDKDKENSLF